MGKLLLLLLLASNLAHSESRDQWLCTDEGVMRTANVWSVCGVGEGDTEGGARARALREGLLEFTSLCTLSTGCMNHKRSVEPKRTTCYQERGWWKCTRMVEITLY